MRFFRDQHVLQRTGFHHFLCQRSSKSKAETKSFDLIKTKCSDFTQMKCSESPLWYSQNSTLGNIWYMGEYEFRLFIPTGDESKFRWLFLSFFFFPRTELQHFDQLMADSHLQCGFPVCCTTFSRSLRLKLSAPLLSRSTD